MDPNPRIKLLAIDGVEPTPENIRNGSYPFTVDVNIVTAGSTNPHLEALIDWTLSPQGQKLIEDVGYVGINS
jgi:phosphate transport system substrate-binding protein